MVMSITFEDLERNRVWTYSDVTNIHFDEKCVCVEGKDEHGKYRIIEHNLYFDQCYITYNY